MYLQKHQWVDYFPSTVSVQKFFESIYTPYGFLGTTELPGLLAFRTTFREALLDWMRVDCSEVAKRWLIVLGNAKTDATKTTS